MHSRSLVAVSLALGASLLLAVALPAPAQDSGVYTRAQAGAGSQTFSNNCAACHSADLSGGAGPPLAGSAFMGKWKGQTAKDLYDFAATQMPLTAPGSLKPAEYLSLIAFILSKNGYKPGSTALDSAKLPAIKLAPQ